MKGSKAQEEDRSYVYERMVSIIKDPRLLEGFTPAFNLGCRRITPGDPYIKAIQDLNVDVHFTPVTKITEHGIVGADGIETECDTIVCATGFDVSFRPRFPIIGQNGVELGKQWAMNPDSYMNIGVPGFPNFLIASGPNSPVANGSVIAAMLTMEQDSTQVIQKLQTEYICSLTPSKKATDEFNAHFQEWARRSHCHMAW